jgi:hypothetical protein
MRRKCPRSYYIHVLKYFVSPPIIKNLNNFFQILNKMTKEIITWDFFHPFFYLLLNKYNTCKLGKIELNSTANTMTAEFNITTTTHTKANIKFQLFTFIDEMCGLFVYKLDNEFHFTTTINLDFIKDIENETKFHMKLNLTHNEARKKIIQFKVFANENLLIKGISIFKKPKNILPMAKF